MIILDTIAEQIQRIYLASVAMENVEPTLDRREIYPLIIQLVNSELSSSAMAAKRYGDILVPACLMVSYKNIPVDSNGAEKTSTLPAYPIWLPRDMGVWDVKPTGGSWNQSYICVPSGLMKLLGGLDEAVLEGQVGYSVEGDKIVFHEYGDAVTDHVDIQLLVADYSTADKDTVLPINADVELIIVAKAVELLKTGGIRPPWQKEEDLPLTINQNTDES
jgi:hypothetical protein